MKMKYRKSMGIIDGGGYGSFTDCMRRAEPALQEEREARRVQGRKQRQIPVRYRLMLLLWMEWRSLH